MSTEVPQEMLGDLVQLRRETQENERKEQEKKKEQQAKANIELLMATMGPNKGFIAKTVCVLNNIFHHILVN